MGRDGGRDGKAGGLRADLQQFACFCASPQLTCVRTKLIAKGLFAKCSQQVDLRTRFEVSANCCRSALRPPAFPDFCGSAFLCLGSDMLEDFVGAGARLFGEYCFVIVLGVIKVCFPVVF